MKNAGNVLKPDENFVELKQCSFLLPFRLEPTIDHIISCQLFYNIISLNNLEWDPCVHYSIMTAFVTLPKMSVTKLMSLQSLYQLKLLDFVGHYYRKSN